MGKEGDTLGEHYSKAPQAVSEEPRELGEVAGHEQAAGGQQARQGEDSGCIHPFFRGSDAILDKAT